MSSIIETLKRLDERYELRGLVPKPPPITHGPWFADDPVARGEVPPGRLVVSPVPTGDITWQELVAEDPSLADYCANGWLAAYRRLKSIPAALVDTRRALHRLAEHVISPARRQANGKIGLRYTGGGFGTPFIGEDLRQVRVAVARWRCTDGV
jgi:hypothetical protein